MLKNSPVLEFLDLEQSPAYSESELESAIIANLQTFLLELGKGFLFEARQKRFTFDEKSFFVDLVPTPSSRIAHLVLLPGNSILARAIVTFPALFYNAKREN